MARRLTDTYFVEFEFEYEQWSKAMLPSLLRTNKKRVREIFEVRGNNVSTLDDLIKSKIKFIYSLCDEDKRLLYLEIIDIRPL